jgi:hypothetical protein
VDSSTIRFIFAPKIAPDIVEVSNMRPSLKSTTLLSAYTVVEEIELATIDKRLNATASLTDNPSKIVSRGTIRKPPPRPNIDPKKAPVPVTNPTKTRKLRTIDHPPLINHATYQ